MKSARSFQQYRPAIITLASLANSCVCAASVTGTPYGFCLCSSWLVVGVIKAKLTSEDFDPVVSREKLRTKQD